MNITVAMPIPFHTSTSATEKSARLGLPSQSGCGNPSDAEGGVDQSDGRLHECGERDPDGDGTDEYREEDDAAQQPLEPDTRSEQQRQRQRDDDFQSAREYGVDERVAQPGNELRIAQESTIVVRAR